MSLVRKNVGTEKDEWQTPRWLFDLLNQEFDFQIDIAATQDNTLCPGYYTKEDDALSIKSWVEDDYDEEDFCIENGIHRFFMNPPYSGGQIDKFMKKAYDQSMKNHNAVIVCLVPVSSDTQWWHRYVMQAQEIRFIEGRVDYIGYDEEGNRIKQSPTFPSCVVIFEVRREPLMIAYGWNVPKIGRTIKNPDKVKNGVRS